MSYDVAFTYSFADSGATAYSVAFFNWTLALGYSFVLLFTSISLWSIPFVSKSFNNEMVVACFPLLAMHLTDSVDTTLNYDARFRWRRRPPHSSRSAAARSPRSVVGCSLLRSTDHPEWYFRRRRKSFQPEKTVRFVVLLLLLPFFVVVIHGISELDSVHDWLLLQWFVGRVCYDRLAVKKKRWCVGSNIYQDYTLNVFILPSMSNN